VGQQVDRLQQFGMAERLVMPFRTHGAQWMILYYALLVAAGLMVVRYGFKKTPVTAFVACLALAGACLFAFGAVNPRPLYNGMRAVHWLIVIAPLFHAGFLWIAFRPGASPEGPPLPSALLAAPAALFLLVVGIGSLHFQRELQTSQKRIKATGKPCVEMAEVFEGRKSSLDTWTFPLLHLTSAEKRQLEQVVVRNMGCQYFCVNDKVPRREFKPRDGRAWPLGPLGQGYWQFADLVPPGTKCLPHFFSLIPRRTNKAL
jgi:hypothetical protein